MWIESHQSLRNHPKIKKAARIAGISEPDLIGRLHYLWWWALDYAPDGDVTKYSAEDIESAVDWIGESGKFYRALLECGFNGHCGLLEHDGDFIFIHDWHDYAGKLIDRREQDAERKRQARRKLSEGRPEDGEQTARVPNQPNQPNLTEPNQPDQPNDPAGPVKVELNDLQRKMLESFNAKRFRNNVQRDAILEWSQYPIENIDAAIKWAATKGFSLGDAVDKIGKALPNWNKPKSNGNGKPPLSGMLGAIARRQGAQHE